MVRPDKRGANVVSTHTAAYPRQPVGFNTQPPEGGCSYNAIPTLSNLWFQHTAARRRLHQSSIKRSQFKRFQHTAARRRLQAAQALVGGIVGFNTQPPEGGCLMFFCLSAYTVVSTHSRPKAAAPVKARVMKKPHCFNTQPPEGGCLPGAT